MEQQQQNFASVQAQAQVQMQSQINDDGMKQASQGISEAAKAINNSTLTQMQQTNNLVQSMQQTQSQINVLASSVNTMMLQQQQQSSHQFTAPPVPVPPPPSPLQPSIFARAQAMGSGAWNALAPIAASGASYATQAAAARMVQARNFMQDTSDIYNPFSVHAHMNSMRGSTPTQTMGIFDRPEYGIRQNIMTGMGLFHNPVNHQSVNFAQWQDAAFRNAGLGASDLFHGSAVGIGRLGTGRTLGGIGGGMLGGWAASALAGTLIGGPLGTVVGLGAGVLGTAVGGTVGSKGLGLLDPLNPLALGLDIADMGVQLGSGANRNAGAFLRGGGSGLRAGQWDITSQGTLGRNLAFDSLRDLTFSSSDYGSMQDMFNERGLNRGVSDIHTYRQNFQQRMRDAREIMKLFNVSLEEAADFMAMEFNQMGLGANSTGIRSKMVAAAHMSGMSPMQIAQISAGGAQQAAGAGLMSTFGANAALSSASLAGVAAQNQSLISPALLATVGGESGLRDIVQRELIKFTSGTGGTLMALGGGSYGTDVMGAIGRAGSGMTQSGIMDFVVNRHSKLSDFSPEAMQLQQFQHYRGLAKQLGNFGASEEQAMRMLMMSDGMSSADAEAFYQTGLAMPKTMSRQARLQSQSAHDFRRDLQAEQWGIQGRTERWLRGSSAGKLMVDGALGLGKWSDDIGATLGNKARSWHDHFLGIDEVASYSYDAYADAINVSADELWSHRSDDKERTRLLTLAAQKGAAGLYDETANARQVAAAANATDWMGMGAGVAAGSAAAGVAMASFLPPLAAAVGLGGSLVGGSMALYGAGGATYGGIIGIRKAIAKDLGISEGQVTGDMVQEYMKAANVSQENIDETLKELGLSRRGDRVRSVEDIATSALSALGIDESKHWTISHKEVMEGVSDGDFREMAGLLDRISVEYDHSKSPGEQSNTVKTLTNRFMSLQKESSGAAQSLINATMKHRGVGQEDGRLSFKNKGALFGRNWIDSLPVEDITHRARADFLRGGLSQMFGEEVSSAITGGTATIQDTELLLEQFKNLGDSQIEKMMQGDEHQRNMATAARLARQGIKLSDAELAGFGYSAMMSGAGVGEHQKSRHGRGLDPAMLATESADALSSANEALKQTHVILAALANDMGLSQQKGPG